MLDGILDDLGIALLVRGSGEALDAANRVVDEVVDQILIGDLLLVDYLRGEPDDDLRVVDEAGLHDLGQLRDQRLLLEQQVVRALLRVDQDAPHSLKQVVEDLLEVGRLVQLRRRRENVAIKDLQEELHVASGEAEYRPRVLNCQQREATLEDCFQVALSLDLSVLFIVLRAECPDARTQLEQLLLLNLDLLILALCFLVLSYH